MSKHDKRLKRYPFCGGAGDHWDPDWEYKCNYKMLPVKKQSPAHDDAAPEVEQEPLAWIVNHPCFCGKFTDDKKIAEYWENEEQGCTAPLFLHPQPTPEIAKLVEAAEMALKEIECALNEAYNNAASVCCQRPRFGECCGEPDPEWSDADKATMDRFAPHHRALEDAIRAYRAQGGE